MSLLNLGLWALGIVVGFVKVVNDPHGLGTLQCVLGFLCTASSSLPSHLWHPIQLSGTNIFQLCLFTNICAFSTVLYAAHIGFPTTRRVVINFVSRLCPEISLQRVQTRRYWQEIKFIVFLGLLQQNCERFLWTSSKYKGPRWGSAGQPSTASESWRSCVLSQRMSCHACTRIAKHCLTGRSNTERVWMQSVGLLGSFGIFGSYHNARGQWEIGKKVNVILWHYNFVKVRHMLN